MEGTFRWLRTKRAWKQLLALSAAAVLPGGVLLLPLVLAPRNKP